MFKGGNDIKSKVLITNKRQWRVIIGVCLIRRIVDMIREIFGYVVAIIIGLWLCNMMKKYDKKHNK